MDGKIFKISGYLVDPDGENISAWIWEDIRLLQRILFDAIICRIRKIKTSHF